MDINFKIIIPCYNTENWIVKCVQSVTKQNYYNWTLIMINDASRDNTFDIIHENFHYPDNRIYLKNNDDNLGALGNIVYGIETISEEPEDVIVLLDGDDWLENNQVLSTLNEIYQDETIWLTYGQYKHASDESRGICGYLTNSRKYRKHRRWVTSHLRSFKRHIWDRIKDNDLRDSTGKYYSMSWDMAFMFPLIEMSGLKRIRYVKKCLYVYNDLNPINDHKKNREYQLLLEEEIRNKPSYDELDTMIFSSRSIQQVGSSITDLSGHGYS